ncbi:hypothetical protein [Senegalia massiliensis]|nr:hypothetical protein [Senegalia massiliensis]
MENVKYIILAISSLLGLYIVCNSKRSINIKIRIKRLIIELDTKKVSSH